MPHVRSLAAVASSKNPQKVAIIGGGVAGLSCAQQLAQSPSKYDVTVFDTGRLRPGGRLSSRLPGDRPKEGSPGYPLLSKSIIDHTAQIIALPDVSDAMFQEFGQQLNQWEQEGVVQRFPEKSLCNIAKTRQESKAFRFIPLQGDFFHGSSGNGVIPLTMSKGLNLKQDVWVSPGNGARYMTKSGQWKITASGEVLGYFDQLIIAHNGKCADRLMSKTPAKRVHEQLRVNFGANVPREGGKKMTLNSIYSLTFAVPSHCALSKDILKEPFVAGYVQNEPNLRFLSCQTRKYPSEALASQEVDIWTVLSSAPFAKKHKAPQEFIPEEKENEVTTLLLQSLERSLGLGADSIHPLESRLQLWGAAVPLNNYQSSSPDNSDPVDGFLYDPEFRVGVCGDWLLQSSVAGAWTSGRRLAQHMLSSQIDQAIGMEGCFVRSEGASKGGIASMESTKPTQTEQPLTKEQLSTA